MQKSLSRTLALAASAREGAKERKYKERKEVQNLLLGKNKVEKIKIIKKNLLCAL